MKKIASALLVIVLIIGVVGCSSNDIDTIENKEYKRLERWYE